MSDKRTIAELKEINRNLDLVVRLLAFQVVEGKGIVDGAPILRKIGMMPAEIANVFGTTPNTVRVAVSQAKTKKVRRRKKANGNGNKKPD